MRVVSPILKHVVYPCLANSGFLRRRDCNGAFCAITYHGIFPEEYRVSDPHLDGSLITAENFRRQLRLLKSLYNVISPRQAHDWVVEGTELPERAVLLTCDDGLRNTLTVMAPILREENLSCLFFVLGASVGESGHILWYEDLYRLLQAAPPGSYSFGTPGIHFELRDSSRGPDPANGVWWSLVHRLSEYDRHAREKFIEEARIELAIPARESRESFDAEIFRDRFAVLNTKELCQLVDLGMSIGAHTLTHPVLSRQPSEAAWAEIFESRTLVEGAIGRPVWAFAYPFGDPASVTAREIKMAEEAGFQCAFMNVGGGFGAPFSKFAIPRVHVTRDMTLSEFEAHVSGFNREFRSRVLGNTA